MPTAVFLASLAGFAASASAQTVPENQWGRGTTLSVQAGAARTSADTSGMFGAALGWELTRRIQLEGTGAWLLQQQGRDAFAAELKVLANLTRPRAIVPFVGGGMGLYHASLDMTRPSVPDFYRRRRGMGSGFPAHMDFNDPSFVIAGGAHVFASRHLSVRPDISVRLVRRGSRSYTVTFAGAYLTYHFEEHRAGSSR